MQASIFACSLQAGSRAVILARRVVEFMKGWGSPGWVHLIIYCNKWRCGEQIKSIMGRRTGIDWRTELADRFEAIHKRIKAAAERAGREPASIRLVAVSKTHS